MRRVEFARHRPGCPPDLVCGFGLDFIAKNGDQYTYRTDNAQCTVPGWADVVVSLVPQADRSVVLSRDDGFTLLLLPPSGGPRTDTETVSSAQSVGGLHSALVPLAITFVALLVLLLGFPIRESRTVRTKR